MFVSATLNEHKNSNNQIREDVERSRNVNGKVLLMSGIKTETLFSAGYTVVERSRNDRREFMDLIHWLSK
jgi:hypothetical protein